MKTLFNDWSSVPTAFVTRGRQRVKQYKPNNSSEGIVYLNNGDEFEIELFNPTTNKVLAQIHINGKSLGGGIVLRPGERVFLERYLDEARKFLFETYEVNKNDCNAMKAIVNNGKVTVEFHCENTFFGTVNLTGGCPTWTYHSGVNYGGYVQPTFTNDVNSYFMHTGDAVNFSNNISESSISYSAPSAGGQICGSLGKGTKMSAKLSKNMETGRVEKGSNSNQSFTYDNTSFNTWWTWKTEWKILPTSQKAFGVGDLKVYCTNCGTKQKKQSHKFCPNCGTKY